MEQDYTSIHAVAWDVEGRLCLYLPVTYKSGFSISLMPGMYAEFTYDGQERGFRDLDEFEEIDISLVLSSPCQNIRSNKAPSPLSRKRSNATCGN